MSKLEEVSHEICIFMLPNEHALVSDFLLPSQYLLYTPHFSPHTAHSSLHTLHIPLHTFHSKAYLYNFYFLNCLQPEPHKTTFICDTSIAAKKKETMILNSQHEMGRQKKGFSKKESKIDCKQPFYHFNWKTYQRIDLSTSFLHFKNFM